MNNKSKLPFLILSFLIVVISVNPITISFLPKNPLVLMASHYALYFAGILAGASLLRLNKAFVIPAVVPPIIFHFPFFFVQSGINLAWTFTDYSTMVVGGVLLGAALRSAGKLIKSSLFVLYMVGDTTLAILLVLGFPVYSPPSVIFSPYSVSQFYDVSYFMFGVMNLILFVVLGYTLRKLLN
ncbi:DUF1404 domain-containing protein [Metallosphaera tengchongensis]|uniref:DUF1404 domain-containing protein n=1 Tax=Metallosphaera tengchongensis TaxID=1532350 RepID=A0A6N0NVW5_9CREN|nr:DUF1404 domain-containing protein [Metallosphaera tengchongensis]